MKNHKGFVLIEILISGVILASCIAASMYLFKVGYQHLGKADNVYLIHSKIPLAINLIKASEKREGTEELGDGVILKWNSELISKSIASGQIEQREVKFYIYLYKVYFIIGNQDEQKSYEFYVVKHERMR
ncbi:MAG: hypothetical protein ABDH16_04190 [Thermodesulfovibrionaceae bacterium]